MKPNGERTVLYNLRFTGRNSLRPVFEDLGRDYGFVLNILRGRVTQDEASLELEISGSPRRVDKFIRLSAEWGASVVAVPVEMA